ncbi:putative RNA-directed DNA polymerase from transposon X-element [Trichonephila clavipes]|uniref:Putative RNA-directed DNA polymerase from transposon X-element n=1 Tax=Trichonephila clavipes TaxID=2585209 RepID=A0A8X6RRQ9_TRICX|nr:putative RNA-directed DNA polymerase from transposon X-element [Trichonephila clavipes]
MAIHLQPEVCASSHLICIPSTVVTLHASLQAVAVRIHIHSLVTVCCVYLPPNDVVPEVDLTHLVSQLPAPFILLGDFNGHSPLWGHDVTNSRGRQIEQLISDHCLCLLNNDEKNLFPCTHEDISLPRSSHLFANSATDVEFRGGCNDLHNSDHFPLLVSHVNGAGKLHSVKPVIGAWSVMPMRRTDVKLTRLFALAIPLHTQAFVVWRTCS